MEDQLTDTQCLTPAEMAGLRRAFERYGTGDGFWLNYKAILDEVSHRDGCDWKVVNKEMQAAFREWSKEDLNRPGFRRHLAAINYGLGGGGYEHETLYG